MDIKRTDAEKKKYKQISTLAKRKTANETIKAFYHKEDLGAISEFLQNDNAYVANRFCDVLQIYADEESKEISLTWRCS